MTNSDYLITTKQGETKLITRKSENYKFYTWAEFLLSDRYVSIQDNYNNFENTPLKFYKYPSDTSTFIQFEQPEGLFDLEAVEISNEWIKIKKESMETDTIKPFFGWTKWKDKGRLIIDFWFLL